MTNCHELSTAHRFALAVVPVGCDQSASCLFCRIEEAFLAGQAHENQKIQDPGSVLKEVTRLELASDLQAAVVREFGDWVRDEIKLLKARLVEIAPYERKRLA